MTVVGDAIRARLGACGCGDPGCMCCRWAKKAACPVERNEHGHPIEVIRVGEDDTLFRALAPMAKAGAGPVDMLVTGLGLQGFPLPPHHEWIAAVLLGRGAVLKTDPGLHPIAAVSQAMSIFHIVGRFASEPWVREAIGLEGGGVRDPL